MPEELIKQFLVHSVTKYQGCCGVLAIFYVKSWLENWSVIITLRSDNVAAFSFLSVAEVIAITVNVKQGQKPMVLSKSRRGKK